MYFRVKPNGQKSWKFRYKKPDGNWSWLGLGGYPAVSGAHARQKAAELRIHGADGKPLVTQSIRKAANSEATENSFESLAGNSMPPASMAGIQVQQNVFSAHSKNTSSRFLANVPYRNFAHGGDGIFLRHGAKGHHRCRPVACAAIALKSTIWPASPVAPCTTRLKACVSSCKQQGFQLRSRLGNGVARSASSNQCLSTRNRRSTRPAPAVPDSRPPLGTARSALD